MDNAVIDWFVTGELTRSNVVLWSQININSGGVIDISSVVCRRNVCRQNVRTDLDVEYRWWLAICSLVHIDQVTRRRVRPVPRWVTVRPHVSVFNQPPMWTQPRRPSVVQAQRVYLSWPTIGNKRPWVERQIGRALSIAGTTGVLD